MTVRPITDQTEAYALHMILGEITSKREIEPGVNIDVEGVTARLLQQLASNPRYLLIGAYDERGAAMGYICGEVREDTLTGRVGAFEFLWVVGDQYRKSGAGLALLDEWEKRVKEMGAKVSYMGLNESTEPEILRFMYPKLGYAPHSASYAKEL